MNLIKPPFALLFFRKTLICITLLWCGVALSYAEQAQEIPLDDMQEELWWGWRFLGRIHPLMVHFPVALIIIAGIMELAKLKTFYSSLRKGIDWLVYIGAGSALLAAILGLLLAQSGNYEGDNFQWHKWTGIGTAIVGTLTAFILYVITKYKRNTLIFLYRTLLFLTVLSIFIVGHYGGSLTHGQDYLLSTTPWASEDTSFEESELLSDIDFASVDSLDEEQQARLNLAARTVFAHHCYQCHGSDKSEAKLRLDQKNLAFKGGESGPVIVPGNSQQSELIRRISLPAGHKEAMPGKGKSLKKQDIEIVKLWIDKGAPWPDQLKSIFRVAPLAPRKPILPPATAGLNNPVDRIINAYFKDKNVEWKPVVDDRTFLRRVYLDILGLPPTAQDLVKFEQDTQSDKREWIIEKLLANNHDYATHWTTFWNDLLRNDYTGTGYITQGRFNISGWLYQSLLINKPYNQFVMELLNPSEESKGFIKGISWRGAINSSQTTAMQAAQNVSQALLGVNLKCASCHDSFVSDWKLEDAYAFANVFSETPLEINRCDIPTGKMAQTYLPWPELGSIPDNLSLQEKSQKLSILLTQPENGRMYRTLVNRLWAQLMGRGIVSPTDEMDREPWSEDLIDWLAVYFVEEGYDIKKLLYTIMTSKTYQQPAMTVDDASKIDDAKFVFKGMLKRKLTAEQFADAVSKLVYPIYSTEALKYNPFADLHEFGNTYPFVRASLVQNDPFQTALGRPSRETITSVRDGQANLLQAMELTNGLQLNQTIANGAKKWVSEHQNPNTLIPALYAHILGRQPFDKELNIAKKLFDNKVEESTVQELLWALILYPEFQFIE